MHVYEVRPRCDKRRFNLISDVLPFGPLWYGEPDAISNAINYAKFFSRSNDSVIHIYNHTGNVIETHKQGSFPYRVVGNPTPVGTLSVFSRPHSILAG
jgi:hypothetical protein